MQIQNYRLIRNTNVINKSDYVKHWMVRCLGEEVFIGYFYCVIGGGHYVLYPYQEEKPRLVDWGESSRVYRLGSFFSDPVTGCVCVCAFITGSDVYVP